MKLLRKWLFFSLAHSYSVISLLIISFNDLGFSSSSQYQMMYAEIQYYIICILYKL